MSECLTLHSPPLPSPLLLARDSGLQVQEEITLAVGASREAVSSSGWFGDETDRSFVPGLPALRVDEYGMSRFLIVGLDGAVTMLVGFEGLVLRLNWFGWASGPGGNCDAVEAECERVRKRVGWMVWG